MPGFWNRLAKRFARTSAGRTGGIRLDRFDPVRDMAVVRAWLDQPDLREWWGDRDVAVTRVTAAAGAGRARLIMLGDLPVGYIQWQRPEASALHAAGLTELPEGVVDIDMAIADGDQRGRGIGPAALELALKGPLREMNAPLYMICSSTANTAAARAWTKAGFKRAQQFTDPVHGPMWLMTAPGPGG